MDQKTWDRDAVEAFIGYFRFDPTKEVLRTTGQVKVHNKMFGIYKKICECRAEQERINDRYEEVLLVDKWSFTEVDSEDKRRLLLLGQEIEELDIQLARADDLANVFGFKVGDAKFYDPLGRGLSIHKEVDKVVKEVSEYLQQ